MRATNRLSLGQIATFSLPVVLFQAIELAWRAYLPGFLTGSVGLSLGIAGGVLLAARIFDAVADPVIGWTSDHVTTRFGRRKPWMALGMPLVSAGALILFLSPMGTGIATVIVGSLLLHLGYSLIVTPHGGWGLELASDPHDRTRLMGAKIWFASAGAIGVLLILATMERKFGFDRTSIAAALGGIIALLAPATVGIVLWRFTERDLAPAAGFANPLTVLRDVARNRDLKLIFALYVLVGIADASSVGTFLFFADDVLGFRGWGAALLMLQSAIALVTLPIWSSVSRRLGRRRVLMIAYAWQALVLPFALVIPAGAFGALVAFLLLRSLSWGVDYMLLRAMVADIADQEAKIGVTRSGSYYGLTSITLKLAMGAGAASALWLIALSGFHAGTPASPAATITIRLVFACPTAVAGIIGMCLLSAQRVRWAFGERNVRREAGGRSGPLSLRRIRTM